MSPSTEQRENREFASELKFLVNRAVADQVRHWARACLVPDPNAAGEFGDTYQISSLYFDTRDFDVFHRRGSFGRSKYRIRRYGQGETIFLERKLKTRGLVSKRRSVIHLSELMRLPETGMDRRGTSYWFCQRLLLRRLEPICQITYDRTARVTMGPHGPIRLTLDDAIRAEPVAGFTFGRGSDGEGAAILEGSVIVEMKYRVEMPSLFKRLIEDLGLQPCAMSKYRLAMTSMEGLAQAVSPLTSNGDQDDKICLNS